MNKTLRKILATTALAATSMFSINSCAPLSRAAASQLVLGLGTHAAQEVISQEVNPEQTNVYVNNRHRSSNVQGISSNKTLVVKAWYDSNEDKQLQQNEIGVDIPSGSEIALGGKYNIILYLEPLSQGPPIEYSLYDSQGNLVRADLRAPNLMNVTMDGNYEGDFMDELNGQSRTNPGYFTISAKERSGREHSVTLNVKQR